MGQVRAGVPHLLVLHGLEGKITAKYAHGLLAQANARGWSGDLLMFRTCDGEPNSARRLYHSGETTDTDFVVRRLLAEHPELRLVICGVSLGGNVLLKWLGELGEQRLPQLRAVVAASVPFDLEAGSRYMEHGFARIYVAHFLKTLRTKTLEKLERYPDLCDRMKLLDARTFWEFDDAVTGPVHSFAGAHDYYAKSSSIQFLERVRVPTLLLNALDDPFLPRAVLERVSAIVAQNPALTLELTRAGGHVGWIAGQPWQPRYYMEERAVAWLAHMLL